MVAPHFHTTREAKDAIKKIGHNTRTGIDGATEGEPTGIMGGSAKNQTTLTPAVTEGEKGGDWVNHRGIKNAD